MIHEIYVIARAALKAKGVPYEFVYGRTPIPPKVGATRIQILRDYESGDTPGPARGIQGNPRALFSRSMGGVVRIFAHSTIEGAQLHDHERLADRLADQLTVEIYKAARDSRTLSRIIRAGFVSDDTTDGWAGAVYEIRFQIDRALRDVPWVADPDNNEGSYAHAATTTTATGPGVSTTVPAATTRIE